MVKCFVERQNFLKFSIIKPRIHSDKDSLSRSRCSLTADHVAENSPNVPVWMCSKKQTDKTYTDLRKKKPGQIRTKILLSATYD